MRVLRDCISAIRELSAAVNALRQAVTYSAPSQAAAQAVASEQAEEIRDLLNKLRMERVREARNANGTAETGTLSAVLAKRRG